MASTSASRSRCVAWSRSNSSIAFSVGRAQETRRSARSSSRRAYPRWTSRSTSAVTADGPIPSRSARSRPVRPPVSTSSMIVLSWLIVRSRSPQPGRSSACSARMKPWNAVQTRVDLRGHAEIGLGATRDRLLARRQFRRGDAQRRFPPIEKFSSIEIVPARTVRGPKSACCRRMMRRPNGPHRIPRSVTCTSGVHHRAMAGARPFTRMVTQLGPAGDARQADSSIY